MSDMNGNPHFNKAIWARQHNAGSDKLRENLDRDAATEATLALAYEQRTTAMVGLLAAMQNGYDNGRISASGMNNLQQLRDDTYARIGLDGDAS